MKSTVRSSSFAGRCCEVLLAAVHNVCCYTAAGAIRQMRVEITKPAPARACRHAQDEVPATVGRRAQGGV
uniref:Secreted protein n=1 Tax=Romanomermis culicivorax TaxID=13658 RepID=A0A915JII6_ROMCU